MIEIILQVAGSLLLLQQLDLLTILVLTRDFDKNSIKIMELHYTYIIVSIWGVSLICLGYFLPLVGLEISYKPLPLFVRLVGTIIPIAVIVYLSNKGAKYIGKRKAKKADVHILIDKYLVGK